MLRTSLLDLLPRHTKGYLWISFLVAVFLLMALSENGVLVPEALTTFPRTQLEYPEVEYSVQSLSEDSTSPEAEVSTAPASKSEDVLVEVVEAPLAAQEPAKSHDVSTSTGLDPKDVVILVKTGATSIWRRMPAHMSTTLGDPSLTPNVLYYSDCEDNINGNPVIDVLANVSATLKESPDFALYHRAKEVADANLYLESGSMDGDFYLPGGWRLDKYKFLPMFAHVAATMPGKKWYIYMEDDNYYFWETLYAWLATLNHTAPIMVGSPAFRLGEDFAHGGSGFAISGPALAQSFGADPQLAQRWEDYAREQCCGDQVLSHVLHQKGVQRERGLDGGGWAGLQALPTWRIGFGTWNWCSPIMNIHKVHQADISRLHVFEREFKIRNSKKANLPPIRYRDIFQSLALPHLTSTRLEWDNFASARHFSSSSDPDVSSSNSPSSANPNPDPNPSSSWSTKPWFSRDACEQACKDWDLCLSWKYADDSCSLDHTAALGRRIDEGIRMESGWMLDRIGRLEELECEGLEF